jgi:hypothetical protein
MESTGVAARDARVEPHRRKNKLVEGSETAFTSRHGSDKPSHDE